ncbi:Short chain isoprenyl diphosphate synthase [Candidatus Bilamarchaeum dharawalense]|uniref:Short chain isoprenyl diphosphate synthase n=1 Tax=Candidatus Bilamarchaeum dharawalense TaxID=2885759 RepID=A0A5E4LRC2_9ARCH|nr:Short chain isoprenyl diphosphate synthase [Candidatus Bilamarchaeum dharawalense]
MEFYSHVKSYLSEVETIIEAELSKEDSRTYGMLAPFIKRGGKRIRPVLIFLSCGAVGGKYQDCIQPSVILEMFHNFTLIHDDIEDDSHFRRGEPTIHITHGIPIALNSGDALYTFLWKKLVFLNLKSSLLLKLQKIYVTAFKKVVDGQGVELSWIKFNRFDVSEKEYLDMINGKTSALLSLSCEMGALLGGAPKRVRSALSDFGEMVGAAFQIQDDILNLVGNFEVYKKEIGGDISEGKRTLIIVHCLSKANELDKNRLISILSSHSKNPEDISEAISIIKKYGSIDYARDYAQKLVNKAKNKLKVLPDSEDKKALLLLADYVVNREQ